MIQGDYWTNFDEIHLNSFYLNFSGDKKLIFAATIPKITFWECKKRQDDIVKKHSEAVVKEKFRGKIKVLEEQMKNE